MFPQALRVVDEVRPQAVMLENVRGLLDAVFVDYRQKIAKQLQSMGYWIDWHLFNAADFGVSQLSAAPGTWQAIGTGPSSHCGGSA